MLDFNPNFVRKVVFPLEILPVATVGASFFHDINLMMQFLTLALMFASAVFYPASKIPEAARAFLRFNPLIHAIELSRDAALWNLPLSIDALAYLYATGIAACDGGYVVFRKLRPAFADVV